LLQRKSTGVVLTEAGRFFYDKAKLLLHDANQLSKQMEAFSIKDSIKMGALPSIGSYFLPSVLSRMGDKYKIDLTIKDTTEELIQLVHDNEIDMAFVQDAPNLKNLTVEPLFIEPYDAIYPSSNANIGRVSLKDFVHEKLVLHKPPCDIRAYFERYCKARGLLFSVTIELESNESIVPFVTNRIGVSIIPRMVSKQIINDSLQIRILENERLQRSVELIYKPTLKKLGKEILGYCQNSMDAQTEKI
jgi:DNA-binding transcriptional LysR family regulator